MKIEMSPDAPSSASFLLGYRDGEMLDDEDRNVT
jgi:hypothetical protein